MAPPVISGLPDGLPPPTAFAATAIAVPLWLFLPTGTWWFVCMAADSNEPLLITETSAFSNEIGPFVLDNAPLGFLSPMTWTPDPSWPAGTKLVVLGTQVQGDYYSGRAVVIQVLATQFASNGLGATIDATTGSTTLAAFTGTGVRSQNMVPTPGTAPFVGTTQGLPYVVDFDAAGNTTEELVAAVNAIAGESVAEFPDLSNAGNFDMIRNAYHFERGITVNAGKWVVGSETILLRGRLLLPTGGEIVAGELTADGSRRRGPSFGFLSQPFSVVGGTGEETDLVWDDGLWTLRAGSFFNFADWLGADDDALPGTDPDQANDWEVPTGAVALHGWATSVDRPSNLTLNVSRTATFTMESWEFRNFDAVRIQDDLLQTPTIVVDAVVFVDVGRFIVGNPLSVSNVRMENAVDGLMLTAAQGGLALFDTCRIVSRSVSDFQFRSVAGTAGVPLEFRLLDFTSDEAADSNDPLANLDAMAGVPDRQFIEIAHRFDLKIVDHLGAAVSGAAVKLTHDATDVDTFDVVTGGTGRIVQQVVLRNKFTIDDESPLPVTALLSAHVAAGVLQDRLGPPFRLTVTVAGRNPLSVLIDPDRHLSYVVTTPARAQDDLRIEVEIPLAVAAEVGPIEIGAVVDPFESDVEVETTPDVEVEI